MEYQETISIIISALTLLGLVWVAIGRVKDPDARASEEIAILKEKTDIYYQDLRLLKENHVAHIENDVRALKEGQVKIFTILEERLPKK